MVHTQNNKQNKNRVGPGRRRSSKAKNVGNGEIVYAFFCVCAYKFYGFDYLFKRLTSEPYVHSLKILLIFFFFVRFHY